MYRMLREKHKMSSCRFSDFIETNKQSNKKELTPDIALLVIDETDLEMITQIFVAGFYLAAAFVSLPAVVVALVVVTVLAAFAAATAVLASAAVTAENFVAAADLLLDIPGSEHHQGLARKRAVSLWGSG